MNTCELGNRPVVNPESPQRHTQGDKAAKARRAARTLCCASLAASVLTGCVATVRVPAPPAPPPVYVVPPPVATPVLQAEVQATEPPPPMPDYEQPPCPEDGWHWTPGYWAFSAGGYYWVPGTWVAPPSVGVVWTPGYWAFTRGVYGFHAGYWGPHVGFYGGVNYGYGYTGTGFVGGMWVGNHYSYNTAVVNVNTTVVHSTYVNNTVVNNVTVNRVSYNGPGGVQRGPTSTEIAAMSEPHVSPTSAQTLHIREAVSNPELSARANGGHPPIAATTRPAAFGAPGATSAKSGPFAPPRLAAETARTPGQETSPAVARPASHGVPPISAPHSAAVTPIHATPPRPAVKALPLTAGRTSPEKKPEKSERPR